MSEKVPVESYVPIIMFGLPVNYEVFLLTRVREVWGRADDNHASIAGGLAATARVITCTAAGTGPGRPMTAGIGLTLLGYVADDRYMHMLMYVC